jgi:hypothetical protein
MHVDNPRPGTTEEPAGQAAGGGRRRRWAPILAAAAVVVTVTAAVFGVRLASVLRHGDLFVTTGGEGRHVYCVWKAQNGLPVYEPYSDTNLSASFFSFGLFYFYGWALRLLGVTGEGLILGGRLLTIAIGAAGAGITWRLMQRLADGPPDAAASAFLAAMAVVLWFGSNSTSWFVIITRPDMAALSLAVAGLALYTRANAERSDRLAVGASLAFFAAWCFKQSVVGILTGVSLHALFGARSLRRALALDAPCALLMATTLVVAGPSYRFDTLTVQASLPLDPRSAASFFAQNLLGHLLIWVVLAAALAAWLRRGMRGKLGDLGPAAVASAFTVGWASLTSGRVGSNKNHLLEMTACTFILASALVVRAVHMPGGRRVGLGLALLTLSMAGLPLLQLQLPNRIGRITLATDAEYAAKSALAATIRARPKPMFVRDEILALPWHASDSRYPAYVLDLLIFDAERLGRMVDAGFFGTLVVPDYDEVYERALKAGYAVEPPVSGVESTGPRILSRRYVAAPLVAGPPGD